jgi:hypothetical protein
MLDLKRYPLAQLKILLRLSESPDRMGFVFGRSEGGSVKELLKNGLIEPAGKVDRRIRWHLVDGTLEGNDIISIKKLLGMGNSDYELEDWNDGFKIVPNTLNHVCAFIVKKGDFVSVFAFRVGHLDWLTKQLKEEELVGKAKKIVAQYMSEGKVKNREELTFNYMYPDFFLENNADWWIKSNPKSE